jgi:hypothetical protein
MKIYGQILILSTKCRRNCLLVNPWKYDQHLNLSTVKQEKSFDLYWGNPMMLSIMFSQHLVERQRWLIYTIRRIKLNGQIRVKEEDIHGKDVGTWPKLQIYVFLKVFVGVLEYFHIMFFHGVPNSFRLFLFCFVCCWITYLACSDL